MDQVRKNNISIAEYIGYTYVPWNNSEGIQPGWQIYEVCESLRSYTYLCRYHHQLNFDCKISRSELILNTLKRYGYSYVIKDGYSGILITLDKPHTDEVTKVGLSIPEVVYKSVLEIMSKHKI